MNKYKCKCGKMANFVAGMDMIGDRYEQYYCEECNTVFITRNGGYLREGVLPEPIVYDTPSGLYNDDDY